MNFLGRSNIPFFFLADFEGQCGYIIESGDLNEDFIRFELSTGHHSRDGNPHSRPLNIKWEITPVDFETYQTKFDFVMDNIRHGNSYLLNLTQPTFVDTNLNLKDIYELSVSKYKLWVKDSFTVFSPETFIKIEEGEISTYPMKGTIDASVTNAEEMILNDLKEQAEHATIVDLLRNDLSKVAERVEVKKYRYIDRVNTHRSELLQTSSEIIGQLPENYDSHLGDIIFSMLPAGSISGAPKRKTLDIIREVEKYERGFYTGIFGLFDGRNLDSAVMIRYIEQKGEHLIFKSGGGITSFSDCRNEYGEMLAKVYVPIY
jgi:para-aminobenzoate synthetase component 1